MEQNLHTQTQYDFRQHDQVWRRVSPHLDPYPEMSQGRSGAVVPLGEQGGASSAAPGLVLGQPVTPVPVQTPSMQPAPSLPGADQNPCCMGSAAAEMLEVITGFIEAELADRRHYAAFARQAPSYARQRLRELGAEAGAAAQRLMAVYYLITGNCYRATLDCTRIRIGAWCPALRERYHVEACNGMNYIRAAEGTTDPCLSRLLMELSQDSYRQADQLMALLERAISC